MSKLKSHTGKIKWFNIDKGYGIIEDAHGARFFSAMSDFISKDDKNLKSNNSLNGKKVRFILDESCKVQDLPRAVEVEVE